MCVTFSMCTCSMIIIILASSYNLFQAIFLIYDRINAVLILAIIISMMLKN